MSSENNSHHILVDEVEDHVCESSVAPVTVDQQQLPQVFEPGDREVTGHHRLGNDTQRQNITQTNML